MATSAVSDTTISNGSASNNIDWNLMPEQLLLDMSPNFIIARGPHMGMNQTWIDHYVHGSTTNRLGQALFARYNIFSEIENPRLDDAGVISAIMTDLDEYSERHADMVEEARIFYSASALDDTKRNVSDAVANYNSTARQAAKSEIEQRDETESHDKIKPHDETTAKR